MKRFLRLVIIAIAICAILVAALDVRCGTIVSFRNATVINVCTAARFARAVP